MTEYRSPTVDGDTVERTWRCIAASTIDDDNVETVDPDPIGRRTLERVAAFSLKADAETWLAEQHADGFTVSDQPIAYATNYHGPTDSPSNAWSVHAEKEVPDGDR